MHSTNDNDDLDRLLAESAREADQVIDAMLADRADDLDALLAESDRQWQEDQKVLAALGAAEPLDLALLDLDALEPLPTLDDLGLPPLDD